MRLNKIINLEKRNTQHSEYKYSKEQVSGLKKKLVQTAINHISDFKIDKSNKYIISSLFDYFMGFEGVYDTRKGLWFMGNIGTGKTSLMHIFSTFLRDNFQNGFKIYLCPKISNEYAINGDLDPYMENSQGYSGVPVEMAFDELGRETIPANHFGQKLNVMQHILHYRYSLWQISGLKTHVITNFDNQDVNTFYDGQDKDNDKFISDRCKEMFNTVIMTGSSRRK